MNSPWEISPDEHAVSRVQFIAAGPQNGRLTATQAREVLLKSGLPQNILAQIWALSDLDKDGHLDEREFSIAIKLTRTALAGFPLPPQLPQTMLQISPVSSMPVMPPPMRPPPMPQFNTAPPAVMQNALRTGFSTGPWKTGRDCGNWVVPHQKKLHFAQQFNQLDKERVGWLSGNVARNAMGQSGLPMPTLAHIWNLSDVNKDGRLNVDEFCIAIHLIEMHKEGYALPDTTPHDLILLCGGDRAQTESPHLEPGAPPPQKVITPRTFEDKRKDNYDKGQAELERRRQILKEEEDRRRAEIERKEREEFERRERERMEKERRAEEMRRAEEERMRALEEQRMEEERKREAEREIQRKAQEKIRMAEMEKVRVKEMQSAKEREAEQTAQRQQRQKTLGFQLQALDEKTTDMNENITEARKKIEEITKEIEGMRGERDEKMKRIQQLHTQHQQMAVKSQELAHALLQLQSANRETTTQLDEIDRTQKKAAETRVLVGKLKEEVDEVRERTETQTGLLAKKEETLEQQRPGFEAFKTDYTEALRLLTRLQTEAREKVEERRRLAQQQSFQSKQPSQESFSNVQNPFQQTETTSLAHGTSNQLPSTASSTGTAKYRAKYEFQGRTEDELSFSEGDVILVFEGHASEPGWLAGQIKDRVGWFPAAFADPLAPINSTITQPIQSASEVATSQSLERIAEEEPVETVASILQKANLVSTMGAPISSSAPVICVCTAQFAWRARNEEDLSFSKGDQIEVIEQQEMKWKGRKVDGSMGWFPKSYVKIDKASSAQTNGNIQALPPAYDTPPGDLPPSTSQQTIKQQQSITSPPPPMYDAPPGDFSAAAIPAYDTPPGGDVITSTSQHSLAEAAWKAPSNDQPNGEWFVAVFDFDAVEDGDLALKTGDRILVIQQQEQWWRGISQGREGVFPANYVQKAEATNGQSASCFHGTERAKAIVEFTASAPNQLALRPGDIITVRQKSEQGWWEGETVRNGTIHAGWFPGNYVQVEEQTVMSPSGDLAVAQFDYEATQHDELSFKTGDKIFVTSKHDVEWWAGHLQKSPSRSGLFPSAYVQMHVGGPLQNTEQDQRPNIISSASSHHPHNSQKLIQLTQELLISEEKYLHDLETAIRIFIKPLSKAIPPTEIEVLSLNWDQLVKLSKGITQRLKQGQTPGSALLSEIEGLQQFIGFCSKQQIAVDVLEKLLKDSSIQRMYSTCCQNPAARGMSLHTLFLVPLGRITRYPLLIEKMIEASAPDSSDMASLDMALSVTKSILEEINRSINESDTMCLLGWCQSHLRVSIQPPLEFAAPTRFLGSRRVLHSGVLWKARSGKVLISILFNDFLLLATPNDPIHDPSTFKLSHQSDIHLTTYRQPFLLHQIIVTKDEIDTNFTLQNDSYREECKLKAASGNACRLWLSHLGRAIETAHQRTKPRASSTTRPPIGRLLVEVVAVESGGVKTLNPHSLLTIRLGLHDNIECFQVDPSRAEIKQSTQFTFTETGGMLRVALLEPRVFSPDVLLYDEIAIPLPQLIADCSQHRGPIRKTIQLFQGSNGTNSTKKQKATIQMKFVVHIYESAL